MKVKKMKTFQMYFVALQSILTIKKGTGPFNFQSNELFPKFLRQQMAISQSKSDAFRENTKW